MEIGGIGKISNVGKFNGVYCREGSLVSSSVATIVGLVSSRMRAACRVPDAHAHVLRAHTHTGRNARRAVQELRCVT